MEMKYSKLARALFWIVLVTLALVECILGLVVMSLPTLIERSWHIAMLSLMYAAFVVFLYLAIYLSEMRSFYYRVPNWDTVFHSLSGLMLGFNMQKRALDDGKPLMGRAALADTMKYLIVGALVAAVGGYLSIRHDPKWIRRIT